MHTAHINAMRQSTVAEQWEQAHIPTAEPQTLNAFSPSLLSSVVITLVQGSTPGIPEACLT